MWAAIRYRRGQALMLLALSAVITTCAAIAPLYDRAMLQALTRLTVDAAGSGETVVRISSAPPAEFGALERPSPADQDALANQLPEDVRPWFRRIDGASSVVTRSDLSQESPTGPMQWREGACEHVTWLAGACPGAVGDIAISAADAKNFGLRVGSAVRVVEFAAEQVGLPPPVLPLRVTGIYRQVPGPYWTGEELEGVSGEINRSPPFRPNHDSWLTTPATFTGGGSLPLLEPTNIVTFDLDRPATGVDRILRLGPLVERMREDTRLEVDELGAPLDRTAVAADVGSGLPEISRTVERGRRQALVTVPVLMIQLGLLALFVLGLTLGAAVEQRRPEVALARLRGAGRTGARRLVLAELLPVVLAGVPLGVLAALALSVLARRTVLDGAAPFELPLAFWLAIVGVALLLAAVTWVATASGTRDRISSLLRGVPIRAPRWGLGALDAVVVAGAGTAVLLFVTGDLYGPAALAAPALLALVAGLLVAHLIVPVATWSGRRLSGRGRYAPALALLAVARRPATRRVVTVVTVASALLVFSAYAVSVGGRNRQLAAERDNGAPTVADVTATDVTQVRRALATVPDSGATTVVRVAAEGGGFRTTLAVDPEPFSRIVRLPDTDPGTVPWSGLTEPTGRRLTLTGTSISLRVTPDQFEVREPDVVAGLQLAVIDATGTRKTVDLGGLPVDGPLTLRALVPCAAGCTVADLSVLVPELVGYSGRVVLSDIRVPGGSTDLPGTPADWRPEDLDGNSIEAESAAAGSLALKVLGGAKDSPALGSRWLPKALPAVVLGGSLPSAGDLAGNTLSGDERLLTSIGSLPRAPGVEGFATLVDLNLLEHWGSVVGRSTRVQVWLDSEDPAALSRVRDALAREDVTVTGVRRIGELRTAYATSVPAWSLQLAVLAAVAGLLLAGLVLVLLTASTWRRRSRDLACLRMTGVSRRGLSFIAVGEQLPVVLLAAALGAGCGVLAAGFALPTVPLFARPRPAAELDLSTPWPVVLAVVLVALVVLGLVSWLCGRAVAAGARLARVRDAL